MKLDQWIGDPAQSDPESEKSQKRLIIEAWKEDLDNFSGEDKLKEKIEEKKLLKIIYIIILS